METIWETSSVLDLVLFVFYRELFVFKLEIVRLAKLCWACVV